MSEGIDLSGDGITIIDDFLDDFDAFISTVSETQFHREPGSLYGGATAPISGIEDEVSLKVRQLARCPSLPGYGRIRLVSPDFEGSDTTGIHLDHRCIVFILYIKGTGENIGTRFYRHRLTGRIRLSPPEQIREFLADDIIMENHHGDYSMWDCWKVVEARPNRAVIFDGHLFHGGPVTYSAGERITVEFFFSREHLLKSKT